MFLRVLRAAGSKTQLILRGSCKNHVNLRSDFVRILRFVLLACAVFCWAPLFFLSGCVVLRFVFFLRLGGPLGLLGASWVAPGSGHPTVVICFVWASLGPLGRSAGTFCCFVALVRASCYEVLSLRAFVRRVA